MSYLAQTPDSTSVILNQLIVGIRPRPLIAVLILQIAAIVLVKHPKRSPQLISVNTDNVGGDAMNQKLSENRAGSVRDYLVAQGVSTNSITAQGFGNCLPVASNNDAAGRQQNRRVELLVSGEAIGHPVNATTGSLR